jgi:hypothetical protein
MNSSAQTRLRSEFHRVPMAHNCRIVGMAAAPTTRTSRCDLHIFEIVGFVVTLRRLCIAGYACNVAAGEDVL